MADYDLSQTIIPYLDAHLTLALLDHLAANALFPVEEVQAAQYQRVKNTNMVDYAVNLFEKLHAGEKVPAGEHTYVSRIERLFMLAIEFTGKRENAVSTNERLQQEAQAVLDVIENPDVAQALRQDKNQNLQYLKDNYCV